MVQGNENAERFRKWSPASRTSQPCGRQIIIVAHEEAASRLWAQAERKEGLIPSKGWGTVRTSTSLTHPFSRVAQIRLDFHFSLKGAFKQLNYIRALGKDLM